MKTRVVKGVIAILATASALLLSPNTASAEPSPSAAPQAPRSPQDQFRNDRQNFMELMRQRGELIRTININFKNACDKANLDFKNAMASAKTPDQKNAAVNARKTAISNAILERDNAIAALGAEPTPPAEPMRSMKAPGKGKSRN